MKHFKKIKARKLGKQLADAETSSKVKKVENEGGEAATAPRKRTPAKKKAAKKKAAKKTAPKKVAKKKAGPNN